MDIVKERRRATKGDEILSIIEGIEMPLSQVEQKMAKASALLAEMQSNKTDWSDADCTATEALLSHIKDRLSNLVK